MAQQTQILKRMYIPNVRTPVIPEVQLLGQSTEQALAYVRKPANRVRALAPRETWDTAYLLKNERSINYNSIRADPRNQAVDESVVKEAAAQLDRHIWQEYGLWMLVLANGAKGDKVRFTFPDGRQTEAPIQTQTGQLSAEIAKALDLPEDANVRHYPDSNRYEKTRALYLYFRYVHERPDLDSDGEPRDRGPDRGVLLGSVVNPRAEAQQELDRLYKEQTELGSRIKNLETQIPSLPEAE